jgi:NADPH:quinone reductase-like Zn-dependent oxidoreductase
MPQAIVTRQFGLGNLRVETWPEEAVGRGLVRVSVRAVSLNQIDLLVIRGIYDPGLELPLIPLSDGAGVVTETGDDVVDLRPGDRVVVHAVPDWLDGPATPAVSRTTLGASAHGLLAEERVLPAHAVLRIPDTMRFEHAACLPVAGLAAWSALRTVAGIGPGSRVLLQGSGGLATMALVLARAAGARVAVSSGSAAGAARMRDHGADFVVDRCQPGWGTEVLEWSGEGVDAVLDVGGTHSLDHELRAVRDGGVIVAMGVMAHRVRQVDFAAVVRRRIRVRGVAFGSRAEFADLIDFVAARRLEPIVGRVYNGLGQARQAIADFAGGGHFGKIVVRM